MTNEIKESTSFVKGAGKGYMFGIDLGTTNSAITVLRGRGETLTPQIIKMEDGSSTLPSVVMWKKGKFTVGKEAYENRYKENVVYSIKRLMGSDETVTLKWGKESVTLTPEEVSAEILKELKRQAERVYGEGNVKDVTITVPAYFGNKQRLATQKAGELAGLNVVSIINEPTSSILAYGQDNLKKAENILVYDLGGGTFDVSFLRFIPNDVEQESDSLIGDLLGDDEEENTDANAGFTIKIIAVDGDNKLGGDDLDIIMYDALCKQIDKKMKERGFNIDFKKHCTREVREELILKIENYKKSGFDRGTYQISIDTKLNDANGTQVQLYATVGKQDFENASRGIYNKTKERVNNCLKNAKTNIVDKIVLVGGSTKSPYIRERLAKDFSDTEIYTGLNPDESVGLGASVNTGIVLGKSNASLFDVIALPIGVAVKGGKFRRIIGKDSLLPVEVTDHFSTVEDNQKIIRVKIYQGVSSDVIDNSLLGELVIEDLPKGKAGEVVVSVRLRVDVNGVLHCFVTVAGKTYSKDLQNIMQKNTEKKEESTLSDRDQKKLRRWKRFADKFNEIPEKLARALEEFENGNKEVVPFIEKSIADLNESKDDSILDELKKDANTKYQREDKDSEE